MKHRLAALALSAALVLVSAGCSTSQAQISRHNARVYVQGVLDETYTGQAQEAYLKLVDHTAEDAQAAFDKNLEAEYTQRLALRFHLEPKYLDRELKRDLLELLDTLYQHAAYTVKEATPLENGRYCVEVSVTPVTFLADAYSDGFAQLQEDFEADHAHPSEEEAQNMDPAQLRKATERYERAWAQAVYDYLYPRLDAVTTGAPITRLVLVTPDSQGRHTLSPTDLQGLDDLILKY